MPGVRLLLGGVKYFVGSFKKKLEKINVALTGKVGKTLMSDIFLYFACFFTKKPAFYGGTEILPGDRLLLGVKYFVGSFKKKLEKTSAAKWSPGSWLN